MFLHLSVILLTGGACVVALGGVHGCSGGACVVALGGVWLLRGGRAWLLRGGGVRGTHPTAMHSCQSIVFLQLYYLQSFSTLGAFYKK